MSLTTGITRCTGSSLNHLVKRLVNNRETIPSDLGGRRRQEICGAEAPVGDSQFAAYDPKDLKAAKNLLVASSDYLYTPRSLFWPDVIFFTAPKMDWGQSAGMLISVQRVVSMEPRVIVVAGSNDHLQSRGLLSRLTDGSIPSNEVIGEAIMTLLSAMADVESAVQRRFTQNVVKVIFVLSPGYATLPEPLQFVYTMVATLVEGRFSVIISAPNRTVDPNNYYPSRSELSTIWDDIIMPNRDSRIVAQLGWCWIRSWGWICLISPVF